MSLKPSRSFLKLLGILAIFAATPLTLLIFYRTGGLPSATEVNFQHDLRYAFMTGVDSLDLSPLTSWPWERVCAVTNGLSEEELNGLLGFEYKAYGDLHWMPRPEYWTLLFVDTRQMSWGLSRSVVYVRIRRKEEAELTLPAGEKGVCVDHDQARLAVARNRQAPVGTSPVTVSLTGVEAASQK
jgi:hypothetical protein